MRFTYINLNSLNSEAPAFLSSSLILTPGNNAALASSIQSTYKPMILWDTFKVWLRGEYIKCIAQRKRQSVQSLGQLEERAKLKEAVYVRLRMCSLLCKIII